MQLFKCTHCGQLIYFENNHCEKCKYPLGFDAETLQLLPLVKSNEEYIIYNAAEKVDYHYCANHTYNVCNWLVPANRATPFCKACTLNHTIPNLSRREYRQRWTEIELAKHRLIYALLRMKLPLSSKTDDPGKGLSFDFMADEDNEHKILTGHDNGVITLNIAEADDVEREMARKAMDEVYRTVLGHFRHEVGHYYWDRLIDGTADIDEYRQLFGDERADYGEALKNHYKQGAPADWQQHFISAYATMHPWEDWAETWAHYLHIMDTLETAYAYQLQIHPLVLGDTEYRNAVITTDPYAQKDFKKNIGLWLPLSSALNNLNRSMGLKDVYPFVIPEKVVEKLDFIHRICYQVSSKN